MSRFARIRRRPDHWASSHERARARAAERLDGPLGLSESIWLDEHLAGCPDCAAIAAAYEADRSALRALRDDPIEPPRDLWARTSAGIERTAGTATRAGAAPGRRPDRRVPVAVLSGLAVVVVVVAVTAVTGGLLDVDDGTTALTGIPTPTAPETTAPSLPAASTPVVAALPTPFTVGAGDVAWFGKDADGRLAYNAVPVRKVCPVDDAADCATLADPTGDRLALTASPRAIIGSPTQQQAIVVTDDGAGGQQIAVLSLPATVASPRPSTVASSPSPNGTATSGPSVTPTVAPTATSSLGVAPTAPPPTASPTEQDTSASEPPPSASAPPPASPAPTLSPEPTIAASLAIASDLTLVDDAAAFSADGAWFAFTARPTDGSSGPDAYIWHVGDEKAHRVTSDGASVFASWDGGELVVSRATERTDGEWDPVTVRIEPETGAERPAGNLWRPVVDPSGTHAVAWVGTVKLADDGITMVPANGRLELRDWADAAGGLAAGGAAQVVSEAQPGDFDVRWDETGSWFAVWVSHPATGTGRLTLFRVDPATGLLEHPAGAPVDVHALPGFSIGKGRLAWATPPGQGGEGSRVQIVAWTRDGVGTVETAPGDGLIVVR
jgi:Putative zinc-finger